MLYALLCLVLGGLVAIQTRVNGALANRMDDGFAAALISFALGLVILVIIALVSRPIRSGVIRVARAATAREIPWWYLTGGVAGAFFVLSQGLTAAVIGVALFTVSIVAGQTLGGLIIDRRGIGAMRSRPVTATRVIGSALALAAVIVAVSSQWQSDIPVWMLVLPFIAGIGAGWQQAVNGQVRELTESAQGAALINFVVGTSLLAVAFGIRSIWVDLPPQLPTEPWLYLGGPIGVLFIAGFAAVVRVTGVLLLGLGAVAGQLIASVVLDALVPETGHVLSIATVAGAVIALIAVAVASIPRRGEPTGAK